MEICHQLVAPKPVTQARCHNDTTAVTKWLIQVNKKYIRSSTQLVQKREILLTDDCSNSFTIKEFTDNILIGFTCFFQKTDFVYADPIAFVLHAMVQDRDSERTHSIADQNHFELCTLDRMIILRDFD